MDIKVIDNFLSKSYHQELLKLMSSSNFDWYYNSNISYTQEPDKVLRLDEFGFTHMFWDENGIRNSNTSKFWKPGLLQIMDAVDSDNILRSRGDMTMYSHEEFIHDPHVDFFFPNTSVVYYVNDSDGDTIFYEDESLNIKDRVSPKANRLVAFKGHILHTGCSPTKHKNRIIINSNFS